MKKLLLLILVVVMTFGLAACGGGENDANNAIMQEKIDKAGALMLEIEGWYEENGYLEGEGAAEVEAMLDVLRGPLEETKALHEDILAGGGYTDEDMLTTEVAFLQRLYVSRGDLKQK